MLVIYAPHTSSRLQYIVASLFEESASLCSSIETYQQHNGVKINYSQNPIAETELQIIPSGLLYESGIRTQSVQVSYWQGLPVFFATNGSIPFDIFSASFYLLSRYEEYLDHEKDDYGRYAHTNSVAWKHQFLDQPIINLWMQELNLLLKQQQPSWHLPVHVFTIQPTYDIDEAYRYAWLSPFRNITGYFFDLLTGRFNDINERMKVLAGKQKDSYDVYGWLDGLHEQYQLNPLYFFLLAEKRKGLDRNNDPYTKGICWLIKQHAEKYTIGIHPSVQSGSAIAILEREVALLAYYADQKIFNSRQHYLFFDLPHTYRCLIQQGIKHDYSMGYGSVNGFRASVANAFFWYDLLDERTTSLRVHPFCYMDSTAIFQERLNSEMAMERMSFFYKTVKQAGGDFIFIMHNHFLTKQPEWVMWRQLYEDFLKKYC